MKILTNEELMNLNNFSKKTLLEIIHAFNKSQRNMLDILEIDFIGVNYNNDYFDKSI